MDEPARDAERCCFDDWADHWDRRARKKATVAGVTGPLLRALTETGIAGRTVLDVGCGVVELPTSDIVVLNRVVCCYPDIDALLTNTLAAAGSVYAYTAPPSRGTAGLLAKMVVAISNAWYRLRDAKFGGFRVS